jgi:hypothetical protein
MWTAGETTGPVWTGGDGGVAACAATAGSINKRRVVVVSKAKPERQTRRINGTIKSFLSLCRFLDEAGQPYTRGTWLATG